MSRTSFPPHGHELVDRGLARVYIGEDFKMEEEFLEAEEEARGGGCGHAPSQPEMDSPCGKRLG